MRFQAPQGKSVEVVWHHLHVQSRPKNSIHVGRNVLPQFTELAKN